MKRIVLLVLVFFSGLSLTAQEKQSSWLTRTFNGYLKSLTAHKTHFDSTYIYQTLLKWTVALESERLSPSADLFFDFKARIPAPDGILTQNGTLQIGLQDRAFQKIGLAAGYGSLRFGYGIQLGKREGERNQYYSFGITSTSFGGQVRYYKIHPNPAGLLEFEGEAPPIDLISDLPGELRSLTLDAFYAFNRKRFLFNAAYTGRHLQRRSAGSWIVSAKYLQGDFSLDPEDPIGTQLTGVFRFATRQLSVGGGYSFNWVPFHRDPVDHANGGLHNLTVNATLLPMISFLNILRTGETRGEESVQSRNQPIFTPVIRGALCYSRGRWSICAESDFSCYNFRGAEKEIAITPGTEPVRVKTRGVFYDFTIKGKVNLHF